MKKTELLSTICETYYFPRNLEIRSPDTKRQYAFALNDFGRALGRPPRLSDLNDESITVLLTHLRDRMAPRTANERAGRLFALWRFLADHGQIKTRPISQSLHVPRKTPWAWTDDELVRLMNECRRVPGFVGDVPAGWWWVSLHRVLWCSGERISALLGCRWEWLSEEWLTIPAETRKGQTEDRTYRLDPETVESLEIIRRPKRDLIWPWHLHRAEVWKHYKRLRQRAGLASDRRSSFHRMRRSVASHFEAAGGNATELLGHSDRRLTKASYLDPRFAKTPQALDKLKPLAPGDRRQQPPAA